MDATENPDTTMQDSPGENGTVEKDLPYDCIIISDLHLGSAVCQAKLLEDFLEWAATASRQLVINGDIFDDLNFKRLSKRHFACLKVIRRHSDRDDYKVVWVRGNHDGPADIISHIVGVDILDEYVYSNGKVKILIFHGDQFDNIITDHAVITNIACKTYYFIQKYAPHNASRWIRRTTKKWQRNTGLIQHRATEYARGKGFKYVTCGHTHISMTVKSDDGITYINSGTWTEHPPCPFVAVKDDRVWLEHWPFAPTTAAAADPDPENTAVRHPTPNGEPQSQPTPRRDLADAATS